MTVRIIPRHVIARAEDRIVSQWPEWRRLLMYEYGAACVIRAVSKSGLMRGGSSPENVERLCIEERAARQAQLLGLKL